MSSLFEVCPEFVAGMGGLNSFFEVLCNLEDLQVIVRRRVSGLHFSH